MSKRRRGLRFRTMMALILPVLICVLLLRFIFVVRDVQVEGNPGEYAWESVVRTASVGFGESIFRVDKDQIEENINATGKLCLKDVQLRYPDTVLLTVDMRSRDAMLLYMGKIRVLDADGYLVESLAQAPDEDLVYVSGMQVQGVEIGKQIRCNESRLQAYGAIMNALCDQNAQMYVSELKLDDAQNARIISRSGITVQLGNWENMDQKIAWMKSAVADLERRGESGGTLDVSSGTKADYRAPQ